LTVIDITNNYLIITNYILNIYTDYIRYYIKQEVLRFTFIFLYLYNII